MSADGHGDDELFAVSWADIHADVAEAASADEVEAKGKGKDNGNGGGGAVGVGAISGAGNAAAAVAKGGGKASARFVPGVIASFAHVRGDIDKRGDELFAAAWADIHDNVEAAASDDVAEANGKGGK